MNELLEHIASEFESEGFGAKFEGSDSITVPVTIGITKDSDNEDIYVMVNKYNRIIYQFNDLNHAKNIFSLILKGC